MNDDSAGFIEAAAPAPKKAIRCQEVRASRMIALLLQMGIKSAADMSIEEAARAYRRMRRGVESSHVSMGPGQLASWATKRRRAKQTHPGKR